MPTDWYKNLNDVCTYCGQTAGHHGHAKGQCPAMWPNPAFKWSDSFTFKAVDKVELKPYQKAVIQKIKKEKKAKNWEPPKFNTPKEPKGEIKYYKPVPTGQGKAVILETVHDGIAAYDYETLEVKLPTLTLEKMKQAAKEMEEASKQYVQFVHHNHSHWMIDYEEKRRQEGAKLLVDDFTQRHRGMHPQQFGAVLLEFAEEHGHKYGYYPRDIKKFKEHITDLTDEVGHGKMLILKYKKELDALKAEMAGMVKRSEVKPVTSPKGRKFKHEE